MANISPLTPLRYDLARLVDGLGAVVAPPYDVIDSAQRAELAARHPRNVVRLILPEGEGDSKYGHAAELLDAWRRDGTLVRDGVPAFYRYDQTFTPPDGDQAITRRGFLALVRLSPFSEKSVLPHEKTLSGPKEDRLKLFRATRTNLSPGFMLYRDPRHALDAPLDTAEPLTDLTTADGVHHALSRVMQRDALRAIVEGVARSALLIADGHHRYETALRYSHEVDATHPSAGPDAEHRFFMAFLANGDDPKLVVFPTHRHVHSLIHFSFDDLLARANDTFDVRPLEAGTTAEVVRSALEEAKGRGPSVAAAARDGRVAVLTLRADVDVSRHPTLGARPEVLRRTDVAVVHSAILEHILGITPEAQAAKTNIWYPQDTRTALAELRGGKGDVLFVMNATPVADVRRVAEAGEVMPQKSTFFYPKVLTGLAIHTLEPDRDVASV
jgi:uncharacterized protein (DUF1015 family)